MTSEREVRGWVAGLDSVVNRIAPRFGRVEPRATAACGVLLAWLAGAGEAQEWLAVGRGCGRRDARWCESAMGFGADQRDNMLKSPVIPGFHAYADSQLRALQGWRLAVVTNCSQRLAEQAAAATGCRFDVVMSAERAGVYKTDPRAYQSGLDALGVPAERVLFVAGSAHDVPGAGWVGMPVYWSNRQGLPAPPGPAPLVDAPNLCGLPALLGPAPA